MNTPKIMPLTPKELKALEVKQRLHDQGVTVKTWSEANGYPTQEVYKILSGERKALYGRAHEIAVKLGLKEPLEEAV